jgi:hypothetical protein
MSETIVERLAHTEPDWTDVERRSRRLQRQHVLRKTALAVGALAAAAILAGGAYAAAHTIWSGHYVTPADIERQATTVYDDKWGECDGHGHCRTVTGTHKEVDILPSMGVVFVLPHANSLPHGWDLSLVPAGPALEPPPPGWGRVTPLHGSYAVGGIWSLRRDDTEYRVTWHHATGLVTERISRPGGQTTTIALQAGDVVPLIPGSTADDPRTLDKAVTFDLPPGERVIIFPRLNETYIDFVQGPAMAEPLANGEAARYGLTPVGSYRGTLPVTSSGGTWTAHLPGGLTRTISWHAGDSYVTILDTTAKATTTTRVPIGHELPLVPFK